MKNKNWFWYPDFLSKQGLLFKAKKTINYPGSKYSFPKKDFIQVNLFKANIRFKSKLTGSIYYRSPANCWKMFNQMCKKLNPVKKNNYKQLRLI
jgi:hypothetical protein